VKNIRSTEYWKLTAKKRKFKKKNEKTPVDHNIDLKIRPSK